MRTEKSVEEKSAEVNSRKIRVAIVGFATFLLLVVGVGCSDPDKSGNNPGVTAPTSTSVTPANATAGACPNTLITATFSKAMNPASLDGTTFSVTAGSASVPGQVTYDAASNTAIFTPSATLALNTAYTATITTGARDMFGNALASNLVWSFSLPAWAAHRDFGNSCWWTGHRMFQHDRDCLLQRGDESRLDRWHDFYGDRAGFHPGGRTSDL